MRPEKPTPVLLALLLLAGCASGPLARRSPAADPLIDQAPMTTATKGQARAYFELANPKAFAFSPRTGNNRHAWGAPSVEEAQRVAMAECEEATRTPCVLFAVDDRIVWRDDDGGGTGRPATGAVAARADAAGGAPAEDGAYKVGVFDNRGTRGTLLQVVNLTSADLSLFVAFLDQGGQPLHCHRDRLSANGLAEVDVRRLGIKAPLGVVRVVALAEGSTRPQAGFVASQRQLLGGQLLSETPLQAVQTRFLEPELPTIGRLCGW